MAIIFPRIHLHWWHYRMSSQDLWTYPLGRAVLTFYVKVCCRISPLMQAPLIRQTPGVKPVTSTIERWRILAKKGWGKKGALFPMVLVILGWGVEDLLINWWLALYIAYLPSDLLGWWGPNGKMKVKHTIHGWYGSWNLMNNHVCTGVLTICNFKVEGWEWWALFREAHRFETKHWSYMDWWCGNRRFRFISC